MITPAIYSLNKVKVTQVTDCYCQGQRIKQERRPAITTIQLQWHHSGSHSLQQAHCTHNYRDGIAKTFIKYILLQNGT